MVIFLFSKDQNIYFDIATLNTTLLITTHFNYIYIYCQVITTHLNYIYIYGQIDKRYKRYCYIVFMIDRRYCNIVCYCMPGGYGVDFHL